MTMSNINKTKFFFKNINKIISFTVSYNINKSVRVSLSYILTARVISFYSVVTFVAYDSIVQCSYSLMLVSIPY